DPFVCPEETSAERSKSSGGSRRRPGSGPEEDRADPATKGPKTVASPAALEIPADEPDRVAELEIRPPDQLQIELADLEKLFLGADAPLDPPHRLALWPEMAVRNAALKHTADAALCWVNRIWEIPENDLPSVRDLAWQWVRAEKYGFEPRLLRT